jgi:hypothetical protein
MSRKKLAEKSLLAHKIQTRVDEHTHAELLSKLKDSDCQNLSELTRRILSHQRIITFTKDVTWDQPMEELCLIRKEINAIGNNINQITRHFHTAPDHEKSQHLISALAQYEQIKSKTQQLLDLINPLAKKWLHA